MVRGTEADRLDEARRGVPWKRWGPYLAERQWGTVREDYSTNGDAWSYFTHDQARSRAYKWGEDGIAGLCDDHQRLCLAVALWNGRDPILKERTFGLTNAEGNHGEDVKEYFFHLDATPTGSYLRYLYRYPLAAYPYDDLVATNRARTRLDYEYELIDTGALDGGNFVDLDVEYAKAAPDDVHVRLTLANRAEAPATVHLLPTLWFRNMWWRGEPKGTLAAAPGPGATIAAHHPDLGDLELRTGGDPTLLFTENETNTERLWGTPNATPYVKDAFHEYVVGGRTDAVNPARTGTKAAGHHVLDLPAGGSAVVRLRLCPAGTPDQGDAAVDALFATRRAEADELYASITPRGVDAERATVIRRALAGMLWCKQHYTFDLDTWLEEHGVHPLRDDGQGSDVRNRAWFHMVNDDVISMPDTWEYPWYASWDLAFHAVALAMVDVDEAKAQLGLMLRELYLHPSGQLPAYEWNFGDVNPPVHAWATLVVYETELEQRGAGDVAWLESVFQKLLLNFTWWINRKDPTGRNVFEGGFLGLDNIGVFDRSAPLPTGGSLEQSDGTAWMAFFAQSMLGMAIELSRHDPVYEPMVFKFAEHFAFIAAAMDRIGDNHDELWDEEDGFFYDVLRFPDGTAERLKVRSIVGLLPLCATAVLPLERVQLSEDLLAQMGRRLEAMPDLLATIHDPRVPGVNGRRMLTVLDADKLRRVLARMLDEDEFLSPHGLRAVSRYHLDHPFSLDVHGQTYEVRYLPAESDTGMFGGNSNWRGPVWFPINFLILRGLLNLYAYYGDAFTVECPTGSGHQSTLFEVATELGRRLESIFLRGPDGRRPMYGGTEPFQTDPLWTDLLVFNEYFHGDNGAGLGASHQTGWTGLIARIVQVLGYLTPEDLTDPALQGNLVYGTIE
jgi:Mannosylglycerate hydrolase MGH1-like glycoside hydrolase domain